MITDKNQTVSRKALAMKLKTLFSLIALVGASATLTLKPMENNYQSTELYVVNIQANFTLEQQPQIKKVELGNNELYRKQQRARLLKDAGFYKKGPLGKGVDSVLDTILGWDTTYWNSPIQPFVVCGQLICLALCCPLLTCGACIDCTCHGSDPVED
jgi:hypothetical protein